MINTLLKAKHWQLFLIVFALPFVIYIGWLFSFMGTFINDAYYYDSNEFPIEMMNSIIYMILLMMIPAIVQYAWFWSMAIGLQKKLPEGMSMRVNLFKAFFIIPIVYGLLYMAFFIGFMGNIENLENLDYLEESDFFAPFILGFMFFFSISLFIMFCAFYQFWFIAKTIKSAQLQREAVFSEFVGEFFLVWFYFIGVWILQPMVNKLVEEESSSPDIKRQE